MNKLFYALALALFLLFSCSSEISQKNAIIKFKNVEQDFGVLTYQKEKGYSFEFTNPGKSPLIIQNVETSCGCTVADWPKKPLAPGKKGEIKIKYDADFPGVFQKTITVYYNGKDSPAVLKISGKVSFPASFE